MFWEWFEKIKGGFALLGEAGSQQTGALDWSAVTSNLIGGGATIVAAFLAFWLGNRAERKRRDRATKERMAANALSGYFKLAQWANLVANIDKHITDCYASAREAGLESSEPFLTVGPSAGKLVEPNFLTAEEFGFLLTKEHFQLAEDVQLVERRAVNLHHLLSEYSAQHLDFQDWLDTLPGYQREMEGPIASDAVPEKYLGKLNFRGAQLNRLMAGIVEHLNEDLRFATETTQKFIDVAHERFQPDFPRMEFGLESHQGARHL